MLTFVWTLYAHSIFLTVALSLSALVEGRVSFLVRTTRKCFLYLSSPSARDTHTFRARTREPTRAPTGRRTRAGVQGRNVGQRQSRPPALHLHAPTPRALDTSRDLTWVPERHEGSVTDSSVTSGVAARQDLRVTASPRRGPEAEREGQDHHQDRWRCDTIP